MTFTRYYLNKKQLPSFVSLYGNQILGKLTVLTHPADALQA